MTCVMITHSDEHRKSTNRLDRTTCSANSGLGVNSDAVWCLDFEHQAAELIAMAAVW